MRVSSFLAPRGLGKAARTFAGAIQPRAEVLGEQLRFLNQHLMAGVLISFVAAVALALNIPGPTSSRALWPWLGASLAATLARCAGIQAFRRRPRLPAELPFWRRVIEGGALAQGLLWGAASTLLFPPDSGSQYFLICVMSGVVGGAIIFLAPIWSAYILFAVPCLLPMSLRMLAQATPTERTVGVMGLVYLAAMLLASGRTSRWLENALLASLDKDRMARELLASNAALEASQGQLEATVLSRTLELSQANLALQAESANKELARRRAADAEMRYRALFEAVSEGFSHVDAQETFILANPAAERIFGVAPGTLVGRNLKEFLAPEDIAHVEKETAKRALGESSIYPIDILRPDGARRSLSVNVSPVLAADGTYAGASSTFQDVTEKNMNEEALRQAQKLESMGVLAGGIAHDFNNLLSAIMGNLNLLQLEMPSGSRSMQLLTTMEAAANRAASLTKQMLAYSGRGRFQITELSLNETVTELTELLQVGIAKGAALNLDLAPDLPAVAADPSQMQQLLMNLVTNASEALEGRPGTITVSTRILDLDALAAARASVLAPVAPGPHVVLEVKDDGSGISPEALPHIFDPFFTTRESGRGLGLSAMLGILRGHGAGIEIKTRPGLGSTFSLYFPVAAQAPAAREARQPVKSRPFNGKVLAVDDEPAVLETVTIMLERMGFQVLSARDGVEALESFRANPDIGLVLLDLTMPRMDGQEAFLAIRSLKAHLPVILSSGYDGQQTMHHLQGPGAPTFLQKPYTLKVLRKTIETALGA